MTDDYSLKTGRARRLYLAAAGYAVLVVALLAVVWIALADLFEQRAALASARDILGQLEARQQNTGPANIAGTAPAGSPFLGGETITVAGATLLQRVAGAITQFGGTVQSSQVDLQGPQAKDGFVTLLISCEMDEPGLQKLLYDLEAGMPFLFVDRLIVQGPQSATVAGAARTRILIALSGQWQESK